MEKINLTKIAILICIVLFFNQCSRHGYIGKFKSDGTYLWIKEDGTYEYAWSAFHSRGFSSGIWEEKSTNKIVLNSTFDDTVMQFDFKEIPAYKGPSFQIELNVREKGPPNMDYFILIYVNDTLYKEVKDNAGVDTVQIPHRISNVKICVGKVNTRSNQFYKILCSKEYVPKNEYSDIFIDISFNDKMFEYETFDNILMKYLRGGPKIKFPERERWIKLTEDSTLVIPKIGTY